MLLLLLQSTRHNFYIAIICHQKEAERYDSISRIILCKLLFTSIICHRISAKGALANKWEENVPFCIA